MPPPAIHFEAVGPRRVARPDGGGAWPAAKRGLDVAGSLLFLFALAPLLLVVAVAIMLRSPGPVLDRRRRLGRDMQPFGLLTFRTDSELLRDTGIDQLPQLFNVLGGSMSLIGPRPAVGDELEYYAPRHFERFLVRPGLSGLRQVSGPERLGLGEMLELDAAYAERCGPGLDAKIFLRTPLAMLRD
jgi:lipopolysaccharide/colanic/teichoic acid biosynthesis glycosyltransferase